MKKAVAICLCFCFLLSGCGRRVDDSESPKCRVVTSVDVTFENKPFRMEWHYDSSAKMRAILNYLRWIDPYGNPPVDPEQVDGILFKIVMFFSDGSEKVYLQKADRYMQIDGAPWKVVDPQKALTLSRILGQMNSDVI